MEQLLRINIYIFTFSLLLVLMLRMFKFSERRDLSSRLFLATIVCVTLQSIWDLMTWIIDPIHTLFHANLNRALNVLIYGFSVLPSLFYLLYVVDFLYGMRSYNKRIALGLTPVFLVFLVASVASPWTGWMFSITDDNVYSRGAGFMLLFAVTFGIASFSAILLLLNRRKLQQGTFLALLLFAGIPLGCAVIQAAWYGTVMISPGTAIGLVILYINLQGEQVKTDYLTGLNNRRELDAELRRKIRIKPQDSGIGAILLDLDDFKSINDHFGHEIGDLALRRIAIILKRCFHHDDFIARYGGDEFIILLDLETEAELQSAVDRLERLGRKEADRRDVAWKLRFSLGMGLYRIGSRERVESFLARVDESMYRNKAARSKDAKGLTVVTTELPYQ